MDSITMTDGAAVATRSPSAAIAARLIENRHDSSETLLYVTRSEGSALELAEALAAMAPDLSLIHLVPWDCLPFDRIGPSAESMGRRMDALQAIRQAGPARPVIVASLEALLQRVPPATVLADAFLSLKTGSLLDVPGFRAYAERCGYLPDDTVDEPGEIAFRDDMVDIFPPAHSQPIRIVLSDTGTIAEIRIYDAATQRTTEALEVVTIGPASEFIGLETERATPPQSSAALQRSLPQLYGRLETVFDSLQGCDICLAPEVGERLAMYLEIIDEARQAFHDGASDDVKSGSLYLDQADWDAALASHRVVEVNLANIGHLPKFLAEANPRKAFADYIGSQIEAAYRVVVAGDDAQVNSLIRRLKRQHGEAIAADSWQDAIRADAAAIVQGRFDIGEGFVDTAARLVVVAVADVLGTQVRSARADANRLLAEPELAIGDLVVHEDHGIGVFRALETIEIDGLSRDAMRLDYHGEDSILVPIEEFGHVWRYGSEEGAVPLDRLHSDAWAKKQAAIGKDIKAAAKHLIALASRRQSEAARIILPPRDRYQRFSGRFPYAETPDQGRAIEAVLQDLSSGRPMNRLICGDVGFGKTEIALRAAAAVALSGSQVVVLAPTTVLARQHFETFLQRFADTGIKVAMLSRLVATATSKQVKAELQSGEVTIVIATQAILASDVGFADLGLVIIDEEHRFGAKAKSDMGALSAGLHLLTMTATPIPRTLQSAMIGIQEVSILSTPPVRRRPIRTYRRSIDLPLVKIALLREKRRSGQSFVVVPRIEDIDGLQQMLQQLVPELKTVVAHGKVPAAQMDEAMVGFGRGEGDILLSTNIIENGLDIPRANTMLIWHADRFGLAQLHQLRGRVGRGRAQGVVYLMTEEDGIDEHTTARLETMVSHDRLGDGLAISARDLDQRGAGDLVGEDQAGHLKLLGVSLYQHMLARAVSALRGKPAARRRPPEINLGMVGAIPEDYVRDGSVRINLYARLLKLTTPAAIDGLGEELVDRYGDLPEQTDLLLKLARLRLAAAARDIARLEVGPLGVAVTFGHKPTATQWKRWTQESHLTQRDGRLFAAIETEPGMGRLAKVAALLRRLSEHK